MAGDTYQGDMDPEIAALLGTAGAADGPPPEFGDIFDDKKETQSEAVEVDMTASMFPQITKRLEEKGHDFFNDPNYYKTALSNEGDIAQRVHGILQKYLTTKDPKDRSVFRQQFIAPFWEFLLNVARKATGKMPPPKKFLLRFALLHPTFLNTETRTFFSKVVVENAFDLPVYYMDEWLNAVGTSKMRPSTTDEVRVSRNNQQSKMQQLLEKANGKYDGARSMLKQKDKNRNDIERTLRDRFNIISERTPFRELSDVSDCLNEKQKMALNEIQNLLKELLKNNHDLEISIKDFISAEADVNVLNTKLEAEGGSVELDTDALVAEFETIRQMAKMTCGRQGNHFPVLTGEYFHSGPNDVGIRENVIAILAKIESIDAEAFCRVYKNKLNRIIPYVADTNLRRYRLLLGTV